MAISSSGVGSGGRPRATRGAASPRRARLGARRLLELLVDTDDQVADDQVVDLEAAIELLASSGPRARRSGRRRCPSLWRGRSGRRAAPPQFSVLSMVPLPWRDDAATSDAARRRCSSVASGGDVDEFALPRCCSCGLLLLDSCRRLPPTSDRTVGGPRGEGPDSRGRVETASSPRIPPGETSTASAACAAASSTIGRFLFGRNRAST